MPLGRQGDRGYYTTPPAGRAGAPRGRLTRERTAFPERQRGSPARAASPLGAVGGGDAQQSWDPHPDPAPCASSPGKVAPPAPARDPVASCSDLARSAAQAAP